MALISTTATIIGSFVNVKKGSKINSITVKLGNVKHGLGNNTTGRHLGLAYWVVDKTFNQQNMIINPNNPKGKMHWFDNASSKSISSVNSITYADNTTYKYVNTNLIPGDTSEDVIFKFNNSEEIAESKIFVALIATRGLSNSSDIDDVKYAWTCYDRKNTGVLYSKGTMVDTNDTLSSQTGCSLNIVNVDITMPSDESDTDISNKPKPIRCINLSYRTWSLLPGCKLAKDMPSNHQVSVADGGETCGYLYNLSSRKEIIKNNKSFTFNYTIYNPNNETETIKSATISTPYVMNDDNKDKFYNDYGIPEGRLSDVTFANPGEGGLKLSGISITQPRWCFKRSRIKFDIPGIANSKYGTIIQYLVRTPITENGIYSSTPKKKFYSKADTRNGMSIVICPRDEGVLDNMPFEIVFTRQYANSINQTIGYKSDDSVYKFHTYQKPIVNITYPKIIRNDSTWEDNNKRNFKYAKIPTSNIYSCFDGEQAIRNKYVCDALNILFSTPKNDDSGIQMFVRFYIAEFKYGRDGCLDGKITTTQDLFKSRDKSKYTSLSDILNGTCNENDQTAQLTNIFTNDGSPLLLSGRFNDKTLKDVGENYHLWTFNTWDAVVEDDEKDVKVFNAWNLTKPYYKPDGTKYDKIISKDIIGDHKDKGIIKDIDAEICEYPVCKMLLFRAGYCYLIRIRMFHGASAGAIGKKYGKLNETCIGEVGTGTYDYSNAFYSGTYPIDDGAKYGNSNPYNKWHGPDDGTSGLALTNDNLNETFPGFSQVDYALFEAVAPYSSISNLITVHPSSPNISVNQCLSFNYRHLAKNIGSIESTIYDNSEHKLKRGYFGRTFGGIHNTISRIMAMYTSCVETMLTKYFTIRTANNKNYYNATKMGVSVCDGAGADTINGISQYNVDYEKLTLKVVPIDANGRIINNGDNILSFTQSTPKTYNVPLINEYDVANIQTISDMAQRDFYTHDYQNDTNGTPFIPDNGVTYRCGCYEYNNYRNTLKTDKSLLNVNSPGKTNIDVNPLDPNDPNKDVWQWPERNIIYKTLKNQYSGSISEEPLGNTYRWQPVINAVQYDNNITKELQIQNEKNNECKIENEGSIANNNDSMKASLIYVNPDSIDGDVQKSYYYQDNVGKITSGSMINMSNNSTNRFTINEFAGVVTNAPESSGYPVMQTMPSNENKHYKYFDLSNSLKTYGDLYTRVPVNCDCENGLVTKNTINFGSLGRFKDINLTGDNEIYSLDSNGDNAFPLVRTTHYLYFKTYINVAFTLKAEVKISYTSANSSESKCETKTITSPDGTETIHTHGSGLSYNTKVFYLSKDGSQINEGNETDSNNIITFANKNGIATVYAEDNNGWGRCLSADDMSAMSFQPDGGLHALPLSSKGCVDSSKISGGIEVPLLVRYTPLLQPKLISETINSTNSDPISKNVTIKEDRYYNSSKIVFNDGTKDIETDKILLNINYPYIPEDETYTTRNINGGLDTVTFENYHVDNDTDTPNNRNLSINLTNMDFLGGYGLCTAYTVLLVPSDPDLSELQKNNYTGYNSSYLIKSEVDNYFKNADGHWNYFKQPNNYYKNGHIYGMRSKTQKNAGPVLVAYNAQLNNSDIGQFITNNTSNGGRTNVSIDLNINKLRKCNVFYKNKWVDCDTFNRDPEIKKSHILLSKKANKLNTGLIYDLVIIPVYLNEIDETYTWKKISAGTINGKSYGSNNEKDINTHFAGSNPLVLFNYLQVSANIIDSTHGGGGGGSDPTPKEPKNIYEIHNTDGAIIFPNVDHELFNMKNGEQKDISKIDKSTCIKESPGFWLNNSFRLVLRLPSYRTNDTTIDDVDNITVENASGGEISNVDDFRFKDIQIHIGKYEELIDFVKRQGEDATMETTLDKITNKEELSKLHIISYKDYYATDGVFSKRLDDNDNIRELATAGALNPDNKNYEHRFIEVNLSNVTIKDDIGNDVPIYTKYPEGYYIQFRVQSSYATNDENYNWSSWYGGSCDGGSNWWGPLGTDYYVPVRNYTEVFTEFRNYIKDSYPGTGLIDKGFKNGEYLNTNILFGKGSLLEFSDTNINSKNKPKSAKQRKYYKIGLGNKQDTTLVGSSSINNQPESITKYNLIKEDETYNFKEYKIDTSENNDWPYKNYENYKKHHDNEITLNSDNTRLWEMLYVDFIIRNMSKLYYKPKYNNTNDRWNGNGEAGRNLVYHLSIPYDNNGNPIILNDKTWGWDNTEYNLFKTNASNTNLTNENVMNERDKNNPQKNAINNERTKYDKINKGRWNLNKYYRKPITKNDFDELNQHLIDLTNFIGQHCLSGKTDDNKNENLIMDVLPIYSDKLQFNKTRKGIIGSSLDISKSNGIGNINNLNNQLTDINYIQKIWDNIKLLCQCYNDFEKDL